MSDDDGGYVREFIHSPTFRQLPFTTRLHLSFSALSQHLYPAAMPSALLTMPQQEQLPSKDYGIREVSASFRLFCPVTDNATDMGRQPRIRVCSFETSCRTISLHLHGMFHNL